MPAQFSTMFGSSRHVLPLVALAIGGFARVSASSPAPPDAVRMALELLADDRSDVRAVALERVRHGLAGAEATRQFAAIVATLPRDRKIELIRALAARDDAAALPALLAGLSSAEDPAERAAFVSALGVVGGATEVAVLKKSLAAPDPEKGAARRALTILEGSEVVPTLAEAVATGEPGLRPVFIEILADRRAFAALPALVAAAVEAEPPVRAAAMRALGRLGGPEQVPGMVRGLLAAAGGERDEAERALVAVCTQNPGKERAAAAFLGQFKAADDAARESLLPALGRVGGPEALALVDGLVADADAGRRRLGLTALARWPDATVADRLLDLIGKAADPAERELLLHALIRIAPLPDNKLDDKQKLALLQKALALCRTDDDRRRVLERAHAIRTIDTLRFVAASLDDPNLAESACLSVVELAHHRALRDAHKEEFATVLDRVLDTTKNDELAERAQRYKEGKTWERKRSG